jgi:hypothetical protein
VSLAARLPFAPQLRTARDFVRAFGVGTESLRLLSHYMRAVLFEEAADEEHLSAAIKWICLAHDTCGGDGVSSVYYLNTGWGVAYPETSGYIIATLLEYARHAGDDRFAARAARLGDWEIEIQAPNGGVFSSPILRQTRVFNTGQVVLGWCSLYEYGRDARYLDAAIRAGDYLIAEQESDGTWTKDTYCGARTYHARVDWALLRLARLSDEPRFAEAAAKNLRWVLAQQRGNGWFANCGFNDDDPITHVIAYTLRGLVECSQLSEATPSRADLLSSAVKGADALCRALEAQPVRGIRGMVPTEFDANWISDAADSCLTGNAQIAGLLYRLTHCTGEQSYARIAGDILSATKRTQVLNSSIAPIEGAIGGTYPLSHGYVANGYPNWAAKFFADALLMKINLASGLAVNA